MTTPYHDYHIGQDVVCINDHVPAGQTFELTKGDIYKIRSIGMNTSYLAGEYLGVRLVGLERGECPFTGDQDPPFRADRFRPLVRDRLATLRQAAADPHEPVQGDVEGPRKRVMEEEPV